MNIQNDSNNIVRVDEILKDLIPGFLQNRRKEIALMESIRQAQDFETMAKYGHQLKGVALNYGFQQLGEVGIQIEDAAKRKDMQTFERAAEIFRQHLDTVTVEFI